MYKTQKDRIQTLEQRVAELEKRLTPSKQHGSENMSQHERTSFLNSETVDAVELTLDEKAFLSKYGLEDTRQVQQLRFESSTVSSEDRKLINQIKLKRPIKITWHGTYA